ncbi:MAG: hypothetical protein Q7V88_06255 [Actinomycetota bacterium]|nr:hypothetical protein [Actinomycetota bacterium]
MAAAMPLVAAATPAPPTEGLAGQSPAAVSIDAEAFARVFAAVFATMIDERLAAGGLSHVPGQLSIAQAQAPRAPKRSFWSAAMHIDVLLLTAAMVIMLVVLAAWLA